VPYEYLNVKKDAAKLEEMLRLSGGARRVPVILEAGKVTVGFGGT
jgi:glutaredoxin 3